MRGDATHTFTTAHVEGLLLPPELLTRISDLDRDLPGLKPADYHLPRGERINEAVNRAWNRLLGLWRGFQAALAELPESDVATALTRERWLLPLFQELGYGRLQRHKAIEIGGRNYAISHYWERAPIHLIGARLDLDRRAPGRAGAAQASPHSLVQQFLNRSDEHLWAMVSNGLRLRLLRDNLSLTRQAYVEFDLGAMMEGELYSDFRLLWLVCHQSRVEAERPETCWLEKWSILAREQGTRALEQLRGGVELAIEALGSGFLAHPANTTLRDRLGTGELEAQDYYRQLLRLVYRLIFLFVAEDRGLLLHSGADETSKQRYRDYYSTVRLRRLAARLRGTRHDDLYQALSVVMECLHERGSPELGLPALGSFLWSPTTIGDLAAQQIANGNLLEAVRALGFARQGRTLRPVDYRHLGSEELGSVYESLLELHPLVHREAHTFKLETAPGHERKTTGSYYTPESLIQELLNSALDPVLEDAATKDDPEEAILNLKVCDPAVGSGHFLVAAAHRMARRLAAVRSGEEEPAAGEVRSALRQVVGHCLYGVDMNPMAVELCKVSLWLEAMEPGKPLTFLDHHIRCGNSLLGTTPELVAEGIPDGAFKPVEGDDKKVCSSLKKRNKQEREGGQQDMLHMMVAGPEAEYNTIASRSRSIDHSADETLTEVQHKAEQFQTLVISPEYRHAQKVANAWCATFVWPKRVDAAEPLTTDALRRLDAGAGALSEAQRREIERLFGQYRFFNWQLEFPEVFAEGGFDVMLGNPPWERVKLQDEEFFATRAPEIAEARNAAARKKLIVALPKTNQALAKEYANAQRRAACESAFLRLSGRYPFGGVGDVNTYAVFADLFRQSIKPRGMAALLLPNGLVTGFTYRAFLRHLLRTRTLSTFYGFENEDKIFPDVHNETKFGILTITGTSRPVERPWFTAHIRYPDQSHDPTRRYSLSAEEIESINPNTLNIPAFRWAADAEVTAAIHAAAPVLVRRCEDGEIKNPWKLKFLTMFHMANDSGLFLDHEAIAPRIVERRGALAVLDDGSKVYPLYEGKMLWHFDHRYGTYEGQTQKQRNKRVLPHVDDATHNSTEYRIQPRYWVEANRLETIRRDNDNREWLFAWRDVGPTERTLVGTVIPMTAAGHKAPVMLSDIDASLFASLLGVFSSLVLDYDARQKSNAMTFFVVEQLAVLTPGLLDEHQSWLGKRCRGWLVERVLELIYTNVELMPFARDLGYDGPPFRWIPERRARLQAEIDAAIFHMYGLNRSQAEWLINTFTVLRKYEERDFGEFRTRRLVLDIYDAMQEAMDTSQPYQTHIDPLPGPPQDVNGNFVSYADIVANPPPHIHPPVEVVRPAATNFDALADGAWARPMQDARSETGAQLAAILKAMSRPFPARQVRLAALMALEPRLLLPYLNDEEAAIWRRLIGAEADPLPQDTLTFAARNDQAWGAAVRNLRTNDYLVEDIQGGTWAPGAGLNRFVTEGWPDSRARIVLDVLRRQTTDAVVMALPAEDRDWVDAAAA